MNLQDKNVPPLLCVEHLKKNFGTHIVLRDVNMKIQKGEVVSIIGASGSGKSTFLRCINHLERPTDGIVSFNGENIKSVHFDMTRYRACFAYSKGKGNGRSNVLSEKSGHV